eukprot:scaffold85158_cov33-Prasinocladus_malaysianus.AAC.1
MGERQGDTLTIRKPTSPAGNVSRDAIDALKLETTLFFCCSNSTKQIAFGLMGFRFQVSDTNGTRHAVLN